jgi:hypothetical protein
MLQLQIILRCRVQGYLRWVIASFHTNTESHNYLYLLALDERIGQQPCLLYSLP